MKVFTQIKKAKILEKGVGIYAEIDKYIYPSLLRYKGENYIGYVGYFNKLGKNTCEVIGNIYENKELLRNENK